jgi:hypothetical protein
MSARRKLRIIHIADESLRPGFSNTPPAPRIGWSPSDLRREISNRNLELAEHLPHESTYGELPSILYQDTDGHHGNFLAASYRRICAAPDWSRRLEKCYTANRRVPRAQDRKRRELDCAHSSDALLMNIFCYPGVTSRRPVCALLGVEPGLRPEFGVRVQTPCAPGLSDRTEIDMALGSLFVEAKLTEGGFQSARRELVSRYIGVDEVFDLDELPASPEVYHHYQLIRGILAAHHCGRSFLLLCDARRADLIEDWYCIVRTVRCCEVRARIMLLTWQELGATLPTKLQMFLRERFGIAGRACGSDLRPGP